MNSPEVRISTASDEIWEVVHSNPDYSVYDYGTALQLVMYDAQDSHERGDCTVQEATVVIAAAETLFAKYLQSRQAAQRSPSTRRVPC